MLLACATATVEADISPAGVDALARDVAEPLRLVLTVVSRAPTLGHVMGLRCVTLTRLTSDELSQYHLGAASTGIRLAPADPDGRLVRTAHTKESLMTVNAVVLLAVDEPLEAAVSA